MNLPIALFNTGYQLAKFNFISLFLVLTAVLPSICLCYVKENEQCFESIPCYLSQTLQGPGSHNQIRLIHQVEENLLFLLLTQSGKLVCQSNNKRVSLDTFSDEKIVVRYVRMLNIEEILFHCVSILHRRLSEVHRCHMETKSIDKQLKILQKTPGLSL